VDEFRILIVEDTNHDFASICEHLDGALSGQNVRIDRVFSVEETGNLCSQHYHLLIVGERFSNRENRWSECKSVLVDPCVILLVNRASRNQAVVRPTLRNPNQFVIRARLDASSIWSSTQYALNLIREQKCGNRKPIAVG
jgi:hypothetical protein